MSDDRERERNAKNHRRARRKRREALEAAGAGMGPTIPAHFAVAPRNALQIHCGQLHVYLLAVDADVSINLETRVRLLCQALPAFARAAEASDLAKRITDLETTLELFKKTGVK